MSIILFDFTVQCNSNQAILSYDNFTKAIHFCATCYVWIVTKCLYCYLSSLSRSCWSVLQGELASFSLTIVPSFHLAVLKNNY